MRRASLPAIGLVLAIALAPGQARAQAMAFDRQIARAAVAWLTVLDPDQLRAAQFAFTDDERFDWNFTPRRRQGLPLRDMRAPQRLAALALIGATLSTKGATKTEAIRALEAVLRAIEGASPRYRDPENYAVSVFGDPEAYPWGWRLEGHHLSINVTIAGPRVVSVTPTFTGSNPARMPPGPRAGERVQQAEYRLALKLVQGLKPAQLHAAVLQDTSFGNIVAGPGRAEALKQPQGVAYQDLDLPQQAVLMALIETYVGLARDEIGRPYMALVRQGLGGTRFAWAGGMTEGTAFYYRIHGPRILIEFDNSQNSANHIHSLWRDPVNDFGRDDLKRHYERTGDHQGSGG